METKRPAVADRSERTTRQQVCLDRPAEESRTPLRGLDREHLHPQKAQHPSCPEGRCQGTVPSQPPQKSGSPLETGGCEKQSVREVSQATDHGARTAARGHELE